MKRTRLALAFAITLVLLGQTLAWDHGTFANQRGPVSEDTRKDITPRGLFINKSADAMVVRVVDTRTGEAVLPSHQFIKDDTIRVVIESNFEGYAYIMNVEITRNSRKRFLLYPNHRAVNNRIISDKPFGLSIGFDENAATEVLQVIVSHDRIDYLDTALNGNCSEAENRCELDRQASAQAALLVGDERSSTQTESAGIFPRQSVQKQNHSGPMSRDIILAPGKDKDAKQTYVAIPIKPGGDGRLKSREAVVFEMRLKHT